MDDRVRNAIQQMEQHMADRLTVAALAAHAELSVSHFTRLFRKETDLTPGVFLHGIRMARARLLVEQTSLSVAAVMQHVGIQDRSHFARDFRRAHGLSPRVLRIQLRMAARTARRLADV